VVIIIRFSTEFSRDVLYANDSEELLLKDKHCKVKLWRFNEMQKNNSLIKSVELLTPET